MRGCNTFDIGQSGGERSVPTPDSGPLGSQPLTAQDGNATHAAEALGISRATLYRRMKEFGIRR